MLHSDFFRMDVVNANVAASINAGVSAVIRHYPDRDVNVVFLLMCPQLSTIMK
jgi:hypothetical protein